MHVGAARATAAPDLQRAVGAVLDRRLLMAGPRPVAVALSGGGDSMALLLASADWARSAGRRLIVLSVDHRLQPQSADWIHACAATAERLGLAFRGLAWTGDKPATGLPAAARAARHALLADAARAEGARVILMGHTADDLAEARLMRAEGSTTPDAREWSPSPVWPRGRGLFLLRPLVGLGRAEIRAWLAERGERWIDDPANDDPAYARVRARQALAQGVIAPDAGPTASAAALALACRPEPTGGFDIGRNELRGADPQALARFVAAACLCAAGTDRPPARERAVRLTGRLTDGPPFVATLAGARIEADAAQVRFRREPGEAARGGLKPLSLAAGETGVWDGRFEITAARATEVRAFRRTTLPTAGENPLDATPVTWDRLLAACGAIDREPA